MEVPMNVVDVKGSARCSTTAFAPNIVYFSPGLKLPVICLMPGQEIPPHPGATGMFYVVEGKGVFTVGDEKIEVSAGSLVVAPSGAVRGIRPLERLILFAVHAGMH
jgi:quercetin dioxygenase-like cupin family protein